MYNDFYRSNSKARCTGNQQIKQALGSEGKPGKIQLALVAPRGGVQQVFR